AAIARAFALPRPRDTRPLTALDTAHLVPRSPGHQDPRARCPDCSASWPTAAAIARGCKLPRPRDTRPLTALDTAHLVPRSPFAKSQKHVAQIVLRPGPVLRQLLARSHFQGRAIRGH